MHKFFLIICLLAIIDCRSQSDSQTLQKNQRPKLIQNDSVLNRLQQFDDSLAEDARKKEAMKDIEQMSKRSVTYFVELQKERRAKEKRNAIIRIAIGVFFLIVLIFGLRRIAKKRQQ